MVVRIVVLICLASASAIEVFAQAGNCTFKTPFFQLHFGRGDVQDINAASLALYNRVSTSCPSDGNYSFCSSTSDCFRGDWHTLENDHTPGDNEGNMLLVNSAYDKGTFLNTRVKGFKSKTTYEFGVWLMNVCKPTWKCPYPLLPNLSIRLQTPAGKTIAEFVTGDLSRQPTPHWTQHRAQFTVPPSVTELVMTLINNAPGGCGNDFALDDITFRECIQTNAIRVMDVKKIQPLSIEKQQPVTRKKVRKTIPKPLHEKKNNLLIPVENIERKIGINKPSVSLKSIALVPVPLVLKRRINSLVKKIEVSAGYIQLHLYDNGEIDGDTVSIYHNNLLILSQQRLSQKPLSLRIQVDKTQPHHELIMVANNLGSIPPNTSLMVVTTRDKEYRVFISSTEQQNAKVIIDLKE